MQSTHTSSYRLLKRKSARSTSMGADRAAFLRLRALIKMNAGQVESALNDMKEALALNPRDPNSLQLDGDLLMKLGRTEDAIAVYKKVLAIDPRSRFALTSLGYASRAAENEPRCGEVFRAAGAGLPILICALSRARRPLYRSPRV